MFFLVSSPLRSSNIWLLNRLPLGPSSVLQEQWVWLQPQKWLGIKVRKRGTILSQLTTQFLFSHFPDDEFSSTQRGGCPLRRWCLWNAHWRAKWWSWLMLTVKDERKRWADVTLAKTRRVHCKISKPVGQDMTAQVWRARCFQAGSLQLFQIPGTKIGCDKQPWPSTHTYKA